MATFKVPVYNARICVFFKDEDVPKALPPLPASLAAGVMMTSEGLIVMVFRTYDADTVTHECIHAAWDVLDWAGIKVDRDNHEALAYVAGFIAGKVDQLKKVHDVKKIWKKPKAQAARTGR